MSTTTTDTTANTNDNDNDNGNSRTISVSVRINKDVISKLDRLGRFKESYSSLIDRLASKELSSIRTRAMDIEKEVTTTTTRTGYETPLENMSF